MSHAYVCLSYHVTVAPDMGSYAACTHLVPVLSKRGLIGQAPCNAAIARVPDPDGSLEACYRMGGPEAVKALVAVRIGVSREGAPTTSANRTGG